MFDLKIRDKNFNWGKIELYYLTVILESKSPLNVCMYAFFVFIPRMIWLAAFGISTGYLVYLLHEEYVIFKQYPAMTSASVKRVSSMQFPAITFCNMSPYNRSKVAKDPRDVEYLLAISRLSSFVGPINWSDPYFQDNDYFRPRTNSDIKYESLNPFGVIREFCLTR